MMANKYERTPRGQASWGTATERHRRDEQQHSLIMDDDGVVVVSRPDGKFVNMCGRCARMIVELGLGAVMRNGTDIKNVRMWVILLNDHIALQDLEGSLPHGVPH
jgi:hypothetical protein